MKHIYFVCISVLEISTNNYGPQNERLIEKIQNGLNEMYRLRTLNGLMANDASSEKMQITNIILQQRQWCNERNCYGHSEMYTTPMYKTSFCQQWYLLTVLMIRCYSRDRSLTLMRLIVNIVIALMIGTLYYNIGNDASMMLNNFRYIFLTLIFIMFTSNCTMTLLCMCLCCL